MGHRVIQRIYTCDICGETPENGEYMWQMGYEMWCKKCCDRQYEIEEIKTKQNEKNKL